MLVWWCGLVAAGLGSCRGEEPLDQLDHLRGEARPGQVPSHITVAHHYYSAGAGRPC